MSPVNLSFRQLLLSKSYFKFSGCFYSVSDCGWVIQKKQSLLSPSHHTFWHQYLSVRNDLLSETQPVMECGNNHIMGCNVLKVWMAEKPYSQVGFCFIYRTKEVGSLGRTCSLLSRAFPTPVTDRSSLEGSKEWRRHFWEPGSSLLLPRDARKGHKFATPAWLGLSFPLIMWGWVRPGLFKLYSV